MPRDEKSFKNPKYPVYLQHLVNPNWDPKLDWIQIDENGFPHQELPFSKDWNGNIVFNGYWQTEKYFAEYRDWIINAFEPEIRAEKNHNIVAVHVRRGDYLVLKKKHPPVPKAWIEAQMAKFPGFMFMFFSDDIPWCKAAFERRGDCMFSNSNEVNDLNRMAGCEHQICSASTFSWWGAWLNPNPQKRIIMPKLWFIPGWGGLDVRDIVPKEWERA